MRGMCGLLALVGGCIGENPRWDEPVVASETTAAGDDADTSEGVRGGDDADVDSTSGGTVAPDDSESSTSEGAETTGAPTTDDGPICGLEQVMCDGECRDVQTDKHYCGVDCVDCTPRFGNNARCEEGMCGPHDGGGDDDD
jgi:hypothetical protein